VHSLNKFVINNIIYLSASTSNFSVTLFIGRLRNMAVRALGSSVSFIACKSMALVKRDLLGGIHFRR